MDIGLSDLDLVQRTSLLTFGIDAMCLLRVLVSLDLRPRQWNVTIFGENMIFCNTHQKRLPSCALILPLMLQVGA